MKDIDRCIFYIDTGLYLLRTHRNDEQGWTEQYEYNTKRSIRAQIVAIERMADPRDE